MYIHLNTLLAIRNDEKKLKEFVEVFNRVVDAEEELNEFYTTYFDDYAQEGEYDDEDRENLNNELIIAQEQFVEFEKKCNLN